MPDWDDDGPRLRQNLTGVLREIRNAVRRRDKLTLAQAREWHRATMKGLTVPHREYVGGFRGEVGKLKNCRVLIGSAEGVPPNSVAGELKAFETRLRRVVNELDKLYKPDVELDADGLTSVLEVAAWTHSQWVRIHPFANGSGRTARLWANAILMRYGVPPVVRLRPRPDAGYAAATANAMQDDWIPTLIAFQEMLRQHLKK